MSNLFIFGAGASAHSGDCLPALPAEGTALFAALAIHGAAKKLESRFGRLFREQFETGMAAVRREADEWTTPLVIQMAKYLSAFAPGRTNFYVQLFLALKERGIPFRIATTNYDLLIERSLGMINCSSIYSVPPAILTTPPPGITVLKIHGSCNFFPDVGSNTFRGISFKNNKTNFAGPIRVASNPTDINNFLHGDSGLAPAMALYTENKEVLFCPEFVQNQQRAFADLVSCSRNIFIIGLRVNAKDTHIWSALALSKASLHYVSPEEDIFKEWAAQNGRPNAQCMARTFEEAIARIPNMVI